MVAIKNNRLESRSPILEQIIEGGSSVSMNLHRLGRTLPDEARLFASSALNAATLFKYPHFNESASMSFSEQSALDGEDVFADDDDRPVETGIFIPNNVDSPYLGGFAIYLRAKNYETLLSEYFGIDALCGDDAARRDLRVLRLVDTVPSLDAFLLKTCFEAEKVAVDPRYWEITETEVDNLRGLIRKRIEPIVRKALQSKTGDNAVRIERFLEAIWNPDMPEAKLFITAFGIEHAEAEAIFASWKGITFYEFQLRKIAKKATSIVAWLKSKDCIPGDIRAHKMWETQLLMYIEKVGKMLDEVLQDIRQILMEYNACFTKFMEGDPRDFATFLRGIKKKYWLMGYCISSLSSVSCVFERYMRNRPVRCLSFDETRALLRQFEIAADRRRERSSVF